MPGGLAGLAFVPQGYDAGGLSYLQLQAAERDKAAMTLLGQAFQGGQPPLQGGPPPGAPPMMTAPPGAPGAPPGGATRLSPGPGQPAPPGLSPPPAGVGGGPSPTIAGQPRALPPGWLGGGSAAAPTSGIPAGAPAGAGGAPAGLPAPQSMSWQDMVTRIVRANPNAPPDVVAAAVTKAMPLLNLESQSSWRQIELGLRELQIAQAGQRIEQAGERLSETERSNRAREEGRRETTDLARERLEGQKANWERLNKDSESKRLYYAAKQSRDEAMSLSKQGKAAHDQSLADWRAKYNAYDKYMRAKIAAGSLPDAEKKALNKQLDEQWGQSMREMHDFEEQSGGVEPKAPAGGGTPTLTPEERRKALTGPGAVPIGEAPAQPPAGTHTLNQSQVQDLQRKLQANPSMADAIKNDYKSKGWILPEGL
jgi:hypothetical protein